ncbi:CDP-diacylglycerol--serine O-phosphatidyltransferase [candidate division KSB1 bacterium]|nr:CDP-diacylglycerol--serine O-phosphatidyltransferase [candidate division KSB1 bacterium]
MSSSARYMTLSNLLTTVNLFGGFLSITMTVAGHYAAAGWIIILSGLFDALDGWIARALGQNSDFGLQADSLADVVSGGVAPSLLLYEYYLNGVGNHMALGLLLAFLPLLFAAFRLARFNVMTQHNGHKPYFTGMPAPMAAASLASLVILHHHFGWPILLHCIVIMTPAISFAMGSHLRYEGFPRFSFKSSAGNRFKLILFFCTLLCLFVSLYITLSVFIMLYFLSGPAKFVYDLFAERGVGEELLETEEFVVDQRLQ